MPQPEQQRELALDVVRKLRAAGYEALWAGGCVRDELLGLTPKDYDVATSATPDQIREKLKEFKGQSDDENFEAALLLALEELFAAEGTNEDLLEAVREVKSQLGEELKDFYQNQVKNYEDVSEVYDQLLGEYGEEDFLKATDTLITRLGSDLQSQGSSVESSKIKSTVDSLYHLEVARNTYQAFAGLMDKMQSVFSVNN